jgi:hypothetical protein
MRPARNMAVCKMTVIPHSKRSNESLRKLRPLHDRYEATRPKATTPLWMPPVLVNGFPMMLAYYETEDTAPQSCKSPIRSIIHFRVTSRS